MNATTLGSVAHNNETFQVRCYNANLCDAGNKRELDKAARDMANKLTDVHTWAQRLRFHKPNLALDIEAAGSPMVAFIRPTGACSDNALACATGPTNLNGKILPKIIEMPEDTIASTPEYTLTLGHEYGHTLENTRDGNAKAGWLSEASAEAMGRAFARFRHPGYDPDASEYEHARQLDLSPYDTEGYGFARYVERLGKELNAEGGVAHLIPWYKKGMMPLREGGKGIDYLYRVPPHTKTGTTSVISGGPLPETARFDRLFPRYVAETSADPDANFSDYTVFDEESLPNGPHGVEQEVAPFSARSLHITGFVQPPKLAVGEIVVVSVRVEDVADPDSLKLVYEDQVLDTLEHSIAMGPSQASAGDAGFIRMVNAPANPDDAWLQDYRLVFDTRTVRFELPECVEFNLPIIPRVKGDLGPGNTISLRTEPGGETMIAPAQAGSVDVQAVLRPPVPRVTGLAPEVVPLGSVEVKESCEPETSNADISVLYFHWSLNACEVLWATYRRMEQELGDGTNAFQNVNVFQVMPPGTLKEPGLQMGCAATLRLLRGKSIFGASSEIPISPELANSLERWANEIRR